ncbi:GTP-binding protein ypt5 [Tritrichomonas foetus]|uniref:GTP-binding protein ypt5 n=1 Tax=Tritrichomonas foetus TaxID=1144522 RepID=A0A1J4KYI4_9EUKA|nr:GTP-binding protein ypt5 [Tritrichomonas foetus]|eukprot:OHT14621.1 GTP-binding protein ypt5 [Tritrichomonas foetus]
MSGMSQIYPRIIFIGDSGVGKTSLIARGATDTFNNMTNPTVGAAVTTMKIMVENTETNFHVWDTAGQEIYRSIVPLYFKLAVCAIVVFAFDDVTSFNSLNSWIDMLQSNSDHDVPVVIVGNKCDLENKTVDIAQVKAWAEAKKYQTFFTSARTGERVKAVFEYVAEMYVSKCKQEAQIELNDSRPRRKKCCQ